MAHFKWSWFSLLSLTSFSWHPQKVWLNPQRHLAQEYQEEVLVTVENGQAQVWKARFEADPEKPSRWLVTLEGLDCAQCRQEIILDNPQLKHIQDVQKALAKKLAHDSKRENRSQTEKLEVAHKNLASETFCTMPWDEGLIDCLTDEILTQANKCEDKRKNPTCYRKIQENWRKLRMAIFKALSQTQDESLIWQAKESLENLLRNLPSQADNIRWDILNITRQGLMQKTLNQYHQGLQQGLLPQTSVMIAKQSLAQELNWFNPESFTRILWDHWQDYLMFENPSKMMIFQSQFQNLFYQPLMQFWLKDPKEWLVTPPVGPAPGPQLMPSPVPETPISPTVPPQPVDPQPLMPGPSTPQTGMVPDNPLTQPNQTPQSHLPGWQSPMPTGPGQSAPPTDLPSRRRQGQRVSP